ncbi:peptidoglycan-binding domain-containing protein [Streptomyces bullii]|uniref:Peptidoglycan-binding protein n=1 Tax=Streptomyces bullii TaxID=349910 RepID=A0ABW0ULK6_9ACTN
MRLSMPAWMRTGDSAVRFGRATRSAVRSFQRCADIVADGRVGSQTWSFLSDHSAGVATAVRPTHAGRAPPGVPGRARRPKPAGQTRRTGTGPWARPLTRVVRTSRGRRRTGRGSTEVGVAVPAAGVPHCPAKDP